MKDDPDATAPIVGNNVNLDYYLLKFSGDVEARWNTTAPALDEDPKIDFRLTGTGRGTITIEYHVWKYTGSEELTDVTIKGNAADRVGVDFFGYRNLQFTPRPVIRLSGCAVIVEG